MIQNGVYNKVTEESRQTVCVKPTGAVYALVAMHTLTTMQNLISNRNANLPPKKNLKKKLSKQEKEISKSRAEPSASQIAPVCAHSDRICRPVQERSMKHDA
jgi:hypothetical protein